MAKGAVPSQEQLLELLTRAAEELKHAKEEARTAVAALQKEQAAHQKTEAELEELKAKGEGTATRANTDEQLLKDQIEAERENGKVLAARVNELEAILDGATAEREALKAKVADSDTAISVAAQQEEAKRQALIEEHQRALEANAAEHARQVEALKAELEEHEAHAKGTLEDAAGKLVTAEQQLAQEREKHQGTAQKLLEARSRLRELEASLAAEHERVKGLEVAAKQLSDAHAKALAEAAEEHRSATADLQRNYQETHAELQRVTENWQQVERQYEALHREMLLTLEQRDDARRLLENEKAERERLSRALQGQR
jgi:chromosome segregation ATPase